MKRHIYQNVSVLLILFIISIQSSFAQIPKPALVGYWENWSTNLKLSALNSNYNVIQLAFATTVGSSLSNMTFTLPSGYSKTTFLSDIDALHAKGKVVILSIGGANDPVRLDDTVARNQFVTTMNKIFSDYSYKFDGIDLDLEGTSMQFGTTWTMTAPTASQTNLINATKMIMANYQTQTGKKLLLTMAPETLYVMGALSTYQVNNSNGGAFLPVIQGLINELDLLHVQLYNAGGSAGGNVAIDGSVYYDNSDPDFITSMTETVIKGFTCLKSKGKFNGVPASKVAIGLPANRCDNGTGSGYNTPADVCLAAKYLQGKITKPSGWTYTVTASYPDLAGLMTWSMNQDLVGCDGSYAFANNFTCAFPAPVTSVDNDMMDKQVNVYPNPTSGVIYIENLQNENVSVYNSTGQLISDLKVLNQNSIDLTSLKAGVYMLKIGNSVKSVIKM